ncbi:MAG: tetratricopeptide repeat protein [Acidobacteriota bacterium]
MATIDDLKNPESEGRTRARQLWETGVEFLSDGQVQSAIDSFNLSLAAFPTAEGYTYRGWAVSFLGMLEMAIRDCERAIQLDPEFGNPYNDIGVYLMQLGQLDEAVPWLERAKKAKRYEPRHFPYLNLGHIFMAKGEQMKALEQYVQALDIDPENPIALKAIASMDLIIH